MNYGKVRGKKGRLQREEQREKERGREGEREGGMAPVLSPVHTPIQTSCITLKTDLVSVDGQDGGTHKEVKGELKVHHASPMPYFTA